MTRGTFTQIAVPLILGLGILVAIVKYADFWKSGKFWKFALLAVLALGALAFGLELFLGYSII